MEIGQRHRVMEKYDREGERDMAIGQRHRKKALFVLVLVMAEDFHWLHFLNTYVDKKE